MIRSFTKWTPQPIGCHETAVGTCSDPPAGLQSDTPDSDWQVVSLMVHQRRPSNSHLDSPVVGTVPLIHVLKNPHVTVQVRRDKSGMGSIKVALWEIDMVRCGVGLCFAGLFKIWDQRHTMKDSTRRTGEPRLLKTFSPNISERKYVERQRISSAGDLIWSACGMIVPRQVVQMRLQG